MTAYSCEVPVRVAFIPEEGPRTLGEVGMGTHTPKLASPNKARLPGNRQETASVLQLVQVRSQSH